MLPLALHQGRLPAGGKKLAELRVDGVKTLKFIYKGTSQRHVSLGKHRNSLGVVQGVYFHISDQQAARTDLVSWQ